MKVAIGSEVESGGVDGGALDPEEDPSEAAGEGGERSCVEEDIVV